jgi:hypothetical protein
MFVKLTNTAPDRKGDPLLINVNSIISVFENHEEGGSLSTIVYGGPNLTWLVEESFGEVADRIEKATK